MAPRLATQLTGALPSNSTTSWDAYQGHTAGGTQNDEPFPKVTTSLDLGVINGLPEIY
jgi:hypothetical protein